MEPRSQTRAWVDREFPGSKIIPLAGDASRRRFFRIVGPDADSRVLMEYTAPFDGSTDDMLLAEVFRTADLPVARILDRNAAAGCLLVEDLGDCMLESALLEAGPGSPRARELYERAVNLAAEIAERGTSVLAASPRAAGPALDAERFRFEMRFFLRHFVGDYIDCDEPPADLGALLDVLAEGAAESPRSVLCHRDFHCRNLMLRADDTLAMVDIQDARWGPDSYDLASLLFDAYAEPDPAWIEPLTQRYREALTAPPAAGEFGDRLRRVAAQRMLKALGTFGYQTAVLGRDRYAAAIPRTQARLRELLPAVGETRLLGRRLQDCGCL